MCETPSLSADKRAELKRLRSVAATRRSQLQAGGAKSTRWPSAAAWKSANGPCPLTDGGIEALA